jgi:hypothetical protein
MFAKVSAAAVAFVVLSAVPAFAQFDACMNPIAPAAVDGSKATTAQMNGAHDDVVNFIKSSDDYQQCLLNVVTDLKRQAAKHAGEKDAKPFDPAIATEANAKIDANQRMKEKVGAEFNAAVHAYQAAHPAPAK